MPGSEEVAFADALVREPGTVMARLTAVDVRAAEASLPADRDRIFAAIERRKGGVPGMEEGIVRALQRWMTAVAGAQLQRCGGDEEGAAAAASAKALSPLQAAYAQFLLAQGRAHDAEVLLREACEAHAAAAGPHAPATLSAKEQRVRALCALRRRLPEAEELAREVVQARRAAAAAAATDPSDPSNEQALALPSALDALAHVLCERAAGPQGAPTARAAFDEAEALLREGHGLRRAALGERHGATLTAAHNLALLLAQQQGRLGDAEALARVVLEGTRASLGAAHADSLAATHNLGVILRAAAAAAAAATDASAASAATSTVSAAPAFASLADEAAALLAEALRGRRKLFPRGHAVVLSSAHALASVHALRGTHDAALPLAREAFKGRRRALGSEHVDTLASGHQLASVLLGMERDASVAPPSSERDASVAPPARFLAGMGESGVRGLTAAGSSADHLAAAELVCKRVVAGRRRALGAEHPDALDSLHLYGIAKLRLRDSRAALVAFRRAWRGRVRALGAGAPQALASFAAFADAVAQNWRVARRRRGSSGSSDVTGLAKQLEPREAGEPGFGADRLCAPLHEVVARVAAALPSVCRSNPPGNAASEQSPEAGVLDSYAVALAAEAEGRFDAAAKAYAPLLVELGFTEPPAFAAALAAPELPLRLPLQISLRLAVALQRNYQPLQAAQVLRQLAEDLRLEATTAEAREMRLHALVAVAELHTSSAEAQRTLVTALRGHEPALPPPALIPHLLRLARLLCASPESSSDVFEEAVALFREALALMAQVATEDREVVALASDTAPDPGSGSTSSIPTVQLEISRALARCGRVAEALPIMRDCLAAIAAGADAARAAHVALLLIKAVGVVEAVAATGSCSPMDASIALDMLRLAQAATDAALRVLNAQANDSGDGALYRDAVGSSFLASCLRLSRVLRTAAAAIAVAPAASAEALTAAEGFEDQLEALARARRVRAERVHGSMRYSPKTGECVVELAEVLAARRRYAPARAVFEEAVADSRRWPREAHTVPLLDRMQRGLAGLTPE